MSGSPSVGGAGRDGPAGGPGVGGGLGWVLLIGGDGMLGTAWSRLLEGEGVGYDAPPLSGPDRLDLEDAGSIERWVGGGYAVVINCAAWTDVDGAEQREAEAARINGDAVGALAERCKRAGSLLVHYSTDYVFGGTSDRPYRVDDPTEPINAYGRTKLIGEQRLLSSGCEALLVRTSWLYAPWGNNFVKTIARLATERPSLRVVDDQRGRPTSCEHLARQTYRLVRLGARGVYHVTDGGSCTWYEFASRIAGRAAPACRVEPCGSDSYPRPAARPGYSVLDLSKAERVLGPMPGWERNLDRVLDRLAVGPGSGG